VGKFIKYLSTAAILSIVPLQVIWLFTNYKSYEKLKKKIEKDMR
jgi:hypothetical protein